MMEELARKNSETRNDSLDLAQQQTPSTETFL